jgi:type I restriction enzyme, S subunit
MESEWVETAIGDAFDLVTGFAFKSKEFFSAGTPVIKIKNVKAGYFSEHEFSYVSPDFLKSKTDKIARYNDLLISMSGNRHDGSPETWVGKVAPFRQKIPYLINQRVGALRLKDRSLLDARFASYQLSSWQYQVLFISIATSSGGQANISPRQILETPFKYPSLPEQKAIAHVLGALDDRIELNRRINETLESMAQVLFKSWFVDFDPVIDNALAGGKEIPAELSEKAQARAALGDKRQPLPEEIRALFPDEFTFSDELGWIPTGWEVGCLEDMVTLQRGFDLPKTKRTKGKFPLIAASGQDGTHNEAKVAGPGVVTGRSGKLGIVNFVQENFWPLNTTLWVKKYKISTPYHAYQLLSTLELERYNSGSAVPTLNRNHVHGMRLLVPPMLIIREFSLHSESMFDKINENQSQGKILAKLRDTLLPKLLSGELRIPDAEKMVEELAL